MFTYSGRGKGPSPSRVIQRFHMSVGTQWIGAPVGMVTEVAASLYEQPAFSFVLKEQCIFIVIGTLYLYLEPCRSHRLPFWDFHSSHVTLLVVRKIWLKTVLVEAIKLFRASITVMPVNVCVCLCVGITLTRYATISELRIVYKSLVYRASVPMWVDTLMWYSAIMYPRRVSFIAVRNV